MTDAAQLRAKVRETIELHRPDASFDDSMAGEHARRSLLHNVANEVDAVLQDAHSPPSDALGDMTGEG
jgi:hypothetical protein